MFSLLFNLVSSFLFQLLSPCLSSSIFPSLSFSVCPLCLLSLSLSLRVMLCCVVCVSTCARGAGTHGSVLNVDTEAFLNPHTRGRRQFCLPRKAHVEFSLGPREDHQRNRWITCFRGSQKKPLDLTHFQFENRSKTTCPRFLQSTALPDKGVQLRLS